MPPTRQSTRPPSRPPAVAAVDIEALLKTAGLKRTPVRVGVLSVLLKSAKPLDVVDLLKRLPDGTEPVTVYRTLGTFGKTKLVHRVRGEDRSWRYALGEASHTTTRPHAHFVCDECGNVECVDGLNAITPKSLAKALPGPGYTIVYPEVVLHGTCPKCH